MKYRLAIFDMDGTILDTLRDLADTMNHALQVNGFPVRALDEIRQFVGNGIGKLVERLFRMEHRKKRLKLSDRTSITIIKNTVRIPPVHMTGSPSCCQI